MSDILFQEKAWADYLYWQAHDKKLLGRINMLLRDISRGDSGGLGKPEPLRNDLSGFWSRRINDEHRLVYRVRNGVIEVLSCKGHYKGHYD